MAGADESIGTQTADEEGVGRETEGSRRETAENRREIEGETERSEGVPVTLSDLTKKYGDICAVDDVSLDVDEGELLVLLGPSGCGKTTTLRMVAGLESISEGSVLIDGENVSLNRPQERDVAMVFQNYALYPHKNVEENIRFPLPKTDIPEEEYDERIRAVTTLLDIDGLLDKQPAALSGGQRQRVAIGRAIVREPSVLLMDEPLSNLDAKLRVKTRAELKELQQSLGLTSIYVTHDQEETMSIADRIAIMNDGRVVQVGTPKEVYEDPDSVFVAEFLGDPSMNLLPSDDGGLAGTLTDAAPDGAMQVGIRPEDCHLDRLETDGTGEKTTAADTPESLSNPHETTIQVIEPIGRAVETTVRVGDEKLVVRTDSIPEGANVGDSIGITVDTDAVYGFDQTGDRIR